MQLILPQPTEKYPPPPLPTKPPLPTQTTNLYTHPSAPIQPTIDPMLAALLSQQGQFLAQNASIITQLTTSVTALQASAASQSITAQSSLEEQIRNRVINEPSLGIFPKFHGSAKDDFITWYNDILAIVSLTEWAGIYNKHTQTVVSATTTVNTSISKHFYQALHLAFKGAAATTMDSYTTSTQNKGVEFFHLSLTIYNPKWLVPLHGANMILFYQIFRAHDVPVDTYAS